MAMVNTLLKKTEKLLEEPQGTVNFIDIDYKLLEDPDDPYTTSTRKMVEHNFEAILNPYRMWLQSKRTDYIRQKNWGGLFEFALNDKVQFKTENESVVREMIISQSNEKFPDLSILDCKVKAVIRDRNWDVEIVVQDKYSNDVSVVKESIDAGE
jgi:hypothetical protein